MTNLYMAAAAAVGAGLAAQAGINAQLRLATGSALIASIISATLTVVLLTAAQLVVRDSLPASGGLSRYPWWIWIGGVAGAAYVFAIVALARPLGIAALFIAIVVGQLLAGLLIDHYGLFNVPVQRVTAIRLAGALLVLAGTILIRWR